MSKFDTSSIENFENLTAEELRAVISGIEIPDQTEDVTALKNALNKASSEASGYKKQLREQMSEADRLKAEREETDKQKDELIAQYQRKEAVGNYTTRLMALGLSEEAARKSAESLPNEVGDDFFTTLSAFKSDLEKSIRADVLKDTPLPGGGTPAPRTAEDIMNIKDSVERQKAIAENMNLFKET